MCEYVVAGFIMSEVGGGNFPYQKVGEIYVGTLARAVFSFVLSSRFCRQLPG